MISMTTWRLALSVVRLFSMGLSLVLDTRPRNTPACNGSFRLSASPSYSNPELFHTKHISPFAGLTLKVPAPGTSATVQVVEGGQGVGFT